MLRVVHAWQLVGAPTTAARVCEGRAFHHFRLLDRALARARDAVERAPGDRVAQRLLAEVYIDRGWPLRARPIVEGLKSAGEGVDGLLARMAEEPARPEAIAREVEAGDDVAAWLRLAESFLATGSQLRATGLLQRVLAQEPEHPRATELLWALAGDYASTEALDAMVKRALPLMTDLAPVPEEAEHTESLRADGDLLLEPEVGPAAFPSLFKRAVPPPAPVPADDVLVGGPPPVVDAHDADDEKTASSPVSEAPRLVSVTSAGAGDTQIMRVVGDGDQGALHRRRDPEISGVLNLRDWQAHNGVDPVGSDLDGIDERDDDSEVASRPGAAPLVEVASAPPPEPEAPHDFSAPIEVVEKHPVPVGLPSVEVEPLPPARRGGGWGRPLVGLAFVAAFGLVLLVLAALIARASGVLDSARVSVDLNRVLAAEDYAALVASEARLASYADDPSERAELARAKVVLWSEFDGNHARLAAVDEVIAKPAGIDAHRLAYLRAAELLAFRNPASALAAIGREPAGDDEERLLRARIQSALGDHDAALAQLGGVVAAKEPRYQLGRVAVLAQAGRLAEARGIVASLVARNPNHVATRLWELRLREGTPQELAAAAAVFRRTYGAVGLSPRQEGEAAWLEARAWLAAGDSSRAVAAARTGLARDGTHRDLLLLLAQQSMADSELVATAGELLALHQLYRADPQVRTDLVLALLEVDRVEEARALADEANPPLQALLRAVVSAWVPEEGGAAPAEFGASTPLGAYAGALLAAQAHRADAALLAAEAATLLDAADDPFVRRLAPRTRALAATLQPEPRAATEVNALRRAGSGDSAAHVFIARYFERNGSRALAAQHFDRAVELEPELGWALYEKGRFYADANDPQDRSRRAWTDYLALAPSGARAVRVKASPLLRGR